MVKSLDDALEEMEKWGERLGHDLNGLSPKEVDAYFRSAVRRFERRTGAKLNVAKAPDYRKAANRLRTHMGPDEYTIMLRREKPAGVWAWVARAPELPGCACTEATPEAALGHIKESIRAYVQEMKATEAQARANSSRRRTRAVSSR